MNQVLSENERLLAQAIDHDIVKIVVNLSVNDGCETVNECQKCLELKTELLNKKDVKNSVLDQNAPSFTQLFELSELRAQSQEKDTVIVKLKEQIKVQNLFVENEHLKQTYKQLYDSIKPKRVQSKEQCDALIKQVNIKSGEISDLNAKLQEQGLVLAALKNELRKLKGKALDKEAIETHSVDPKVSKDNVEPITPKLLNKRTAHSSYIKHTQEEAFVLRDIVEHVKANYPQDSLLESAFRYTKVIQELLSHISRTCPSINNFDPQLVAVTPRKKDKKVRFAESLTSTENTKTDSTSNIVSNKHVLHSTGVRLSTSASGSQPSGNYQGMIKIHQTPSRIRRIKIPRNMIILNYVRLKETVRRIRTDNGTEFVNQTLREYYEKVGISHETLVARSPQQNGVVERRNRTLIEAARTMLIYAKAPLFLWAEAVATAYNHDIEVAHMGHDPYFGILILEVASDQSSSSDLSLQQLPVSTRLQLYEQALFCYYDAFLTSVESKNYEDALTQACWIEAMQEELHEFKRLEVWELVPPPDKALVITLIRLSLMSYEVSEKQGSFGRSWLSSRSGNRF
ncbi:retrovirus-related pol polyprotein from transposon TNT 1-94 [Tanacetum coccineum]